MDKQVMIKLAKPNISEDTINTVSNILRSGNLVQGEYVEKFENDLKSYLNVEHAIVVSSGTAALHLSLLALGIKAGDEVIVPAFTYPATANVVEIVGATSIFVDITLDDFCIDVTKIEEAITNKTKAIIPVHEFGQSADIVPIMLLAKKHNLKIIEDAACALGTEYNNQKVGSFGDIGCFSFHPRKAITTGDGGVAVTNSKKLANKLRSLRNHGISTLNNKIHFKYAGLNYRMTEFQAALGIDQLKDFNKHILHRIKLAKLYNKLLKDIDWIKFPDLFSERKMTYQSYHVMVDKNIDRDNLIKYLKENNIETNYGAQAVHIQNYYKKKYDIKEDQFTNAKKAYYRGLVLPIGSHIHKDDILLIKKVMENYYENKN